MFLVGIISWWYGQGFRSQFVRVRQQLTSMADLFSIGQLASTLFSPFRQISADRASGSLSVMARAFFDQLISRTIGAIVRLFTIVIGCVVLIVQSIFEALSIMLWIVLPAIPVVGLILVAIGWVPRWM